MKIDKELKDYCKSMSTAEARMLVDSYYEAQGKRIDIENKIRSIKQGVDDNINTAGLEWQLSKRKDEEHEIELMLKYFYPIGIELHIWLLLAKSRQNHTL